MPEFCWDMIIIAMQLVSKLFSRDLRLTTLETVVAELYMRLALCPGLAMSQKMKQCKLQKLHIGKQPKTAQAFNTNTTNLIARLTTQNAKFPKHANALKFNVTSMRNKTSA